MNKKLVSFRLEEQLIERSKIRAKKLGMTLTDLVAKSLENYKFEAELTEQGVLTDFDKRDLKQSIEMISKEFNSKIQHIKAKLD